ncbi:MAG: DUF4178 domain-containing protein [Comamonas sp.]
MTTDQQRSYTAPCPGCGAPVEFASAQSAYAVCQYCQSSIVREGEVLKRIGKMAEIFNDYSPLKLGQTGQFAKGKDGKPEGFRLVGRLQYKGETGSWNDWQALTDSGEIASISEDNGQFVLSRASTAQARSLPEEQRWRPGQNVAINGVQYGVTSVVQAQLMAAEGEMPHQPVLGKPFTVVELRTQDNQVLSIDYSEQPPSIYLGGPVHLPDLKIAGLKEKSAKKEKGRHFNCPRCAARVEIKLQTTQSLTCPSCGSIIDVSSGIGSELLSAEQNEPVKPLIALGKRGKFAGSTWQVVGFQHRMGVEADDDEYFGWDEYLLYHAQQGFQFLVNSSDGWSLLKTLTGAPKYRAGAETATWKDLLYTRLYSYQAETTYVLGEFYWPVARGDKTDNVDFARDTTNDQLLNLEQSRREVNWSIGRKLAPETVATAFGMTDQLALFKPKSDEISLPKFGCLPIIIGLLIVFFLAIWLWPKGCNAAEERRRLAADPTYVSKCSSGRSSGGAWGGYSSGGSHK